MKKIKKQFDAAIHVLKNNAAIVMCCGSNEAWRDDCLSAVEALKKERARTVRPKAARTTSGTKAALEYVINGWFRELDEGRFKIYVPYSMRTRLIERLNTALKLN